jgi:transcriptional regulator with XRE-family HTH domain
VGRLLATLKDIANYLNVSVSTVSRVANNRNRVDTETRKKISEALQKGRVEKLPFLSNELSTIKTAIFSIFT